MIAESERKMAEMAQVGSIDPPHGKTFSEYLVAVLCWPVEMVIMAITYLICGVILAVSGVVVFIMEFVFNFVVGAIVLLLSFWVLGAILKVCWMIWGPKQ